MRLHEFEEVRTAINVAIFLGGAVVCFLLVSMGVVDKIDGIPGTQTEPEISLPTYLGFLSVMLSAVSVILTALAIGIGVVAAYTFRGIRDEVQGNLDARAVEAQRKLDAALRAIEEKADAAVAGALVAARKDPIGMAIGPGLTVAELEEDFDREDDGNR